MSPTQDCNKTTVEGSVPLASLQGVKNVAEAALAAGTVKRMVLVSSMLTHPSNRQVEEKNSAYERLGLCSAQGFGYRAYCSARWMVWCRSRGVQWWCCCCTTHMQLRNMHAVVSSSFRIEQGCLVV